MYKKIMFILLTMLFMSGSCNLEGKKSSISSKKAHTASTPIDTTTINLVDTHKDVIKFNYLGFIIMIPDPFNVQVKSIKISTTEVALRAAGITKLSEAKNMTSGFKLSKLIKSLTFTIKAVTTSPPVEELTIKSDYENLKTIYEGLRKTANDPSLKPRLNINGKVVEFDQGLIKGKDLYYFNSASSNNHLISFNEGEQHSKMKDFLNEILGINTIVYFKKYIP